MLGVDRQFTRKDTLNLSEKVALQWRGEGQYVCVGKTMHKHGALNVRRTYFGATNIHRISIGSFHLQAPLSCLMPMFQVQTGTGIVTLSTANLTVTELLPRIWVGVTLWTLFARTHGHRASPGTIKVQTNQSLSSYKKPHSSQGLKK
jgi:hypothetical protein